MGRIQGSIISSLLHSNTKTAQMGSSCVQTTVPHKWTFLIYNNTPKCGLGTKSNSFI